ncbi:HvfC/BufC N-terminal domain-containing protein [Parvibaculum sp.]|jgi:hypothetical protein|uniref:HvfC/BufC N-terminal domain-containing protein n=1 Tax=Parvibaculum sp. TaxID=2024848 RepID=UPI002FD98974
MAEGLARFQAGFAGALREGTHEPAGLRALPRTPGTAKRFDVYRNNVHASLIDALAAAFPVVERLVGRDFFRAAARVHLEEGFPRRGTLIGYGEGFPDFLERFPPAQGLAYLGDVARLELLWLEAYHAAEAEPVAPSSFAAHGAALTTMKPVLHPSFRLFSSRFPVAEIWRTNREDEEVRPVKSNGRRDTLMLVRPGADVFIHGLRPEQFVFLKALRDGASLGEAALHLPAAAIRDLPAMLAGFAARGVFAASDGTTFNRRNGEDG